MLVKRPWTVKGVYSFNLNGSTQMLHGLGNRQTKNLVAAGVAAGGDGLANRPLLQGKRVAFDGQPDRDLMAPFAAVNELAGRPFCSGNACLGKKIDESSWRG